MFAHGQKGGVRVSYALEFLLSSIILWGPEFVAGQRKNQLGGER
jgi:hypothetical protein